MPVTALRTKNSILERDQDGRIEGHGAHVLPQTHQKYI